MFTALPSTQTAQSAPRFRIRTHTALLIAVVVLAAALRLINLSSIGDGNTYYTAAVASMIQSPANFFFAAAEPGGSVTVDKPPLGLIIQAIFAAIFGVSGIVVVIPQIIAGMLSVLLLYHLIARSYGAGAGLVAALALAVTPISVLTDRNNTMDSTLILTLLCAAWMFLKATESRKLLWLLAGAGLVGLGFNIKMMQAFLPLPAFLLLEFFASKFGLGTKLLRLIAALVVLVLVAFSWALIVDSIPPESRPYIGSSQNNSVFDLIFGYNGLERLNGVERTNGTSPLGGAQGQPRQGGMQPPNGGQSGQPPAGFQLPNGAQGGIPAGNGSNPMASETGEPHVLRLFKTELGNELGWMLPFALMATLYGSIHLLIMFARQPQFPIDDEYKGVVLWGGWLVTMIVFFSMARFFHAYYLATIAPAAAAMTGIGFWYLWKLAKQRGSPGFIALLGALIITLLIQGLIAGQYTVSLIWLIPAGALILIGVILIALDQPSTLRIGFALAAIAIMIAPLLWSIWSVTDPAPNVALPSAYAGETDSSVSTLGNMPLPINGAAGMNSILRTASDELVTYLQENTADMEYLLAVPNAMIGAQFILETRRPVLLMGGFSGNDPVITVEAFAQWVNSGRLRYLLSLGNMSGGTTAAINAWAADHCTPAEGINLIGDAAMLPPAGMREIAMPTLYDCQPND